MSKADRDSRLAVTTRTVGSQYYDQVLAMSAHVVNDGWVKLFGKYKDLQRIDFDDEDIGKLHGELLPCRISFDGDNRAGVRVFYQIRFASGTLETPSGSLKADLKDWILTVSVGVSEQPKEQMTEKQKQYIKDNFNIPGDYSIARLFADLTDADWNKMEEDRSQFGKDGKGNPISWDDWKTANPKLKIKLISFLDGWVDDMKDKGYSTLGVKVVIPNYHEQNPLDPTFPPTALVHQGFKYNNKDTPAKVARDYDCILYCEQLMNHSLPKASFIADGGNWCYPEAEGYPAVHGTFAISGQIFFERNNGLLQHMRPFSRLSEITLDSVKIYDDGGMNHFFDVGHNPEHESVTDNYFLPKIDEATHQYIWTKTHTQDGSKTLDWEYCYCRHQSDQTVTISWAPGSGSLTLAGKTTYSYASQWWKNPDKTELTGYLEESYTASWSVPIDIKTDKDGRLTLALGEKPEDVIVSIKQDYHRELNIDGKQDTPEGYQKTIQTALRAALVIVEGNLAQIFKTTGQWVYPGNGTLSFDNPMFNNHGDVLAEVQYKDIGKVEVPHPVGGSTLQSYPSTTANIHSFKTTK